MLSRRTYGIFIPGFGHFASARGFGRLGRVIRERFESFMTAVYQSGKRDLRLAD